MKSKSTPKKMAGCYLSLPLDCYRHSEVVQPRNCEMRACQVVDGIKASSSCLKCYQHLEIQSCQNLALRTCSYAIRALFRLRGTFNYPPESHLRGSHRNSSVCFPSFAMHPPDPTQIRLDTAPQIFPTQASPPRFFKVHTNIKLGCR